jgi:purine-binding chemotaxis protein CheW
MSISQYVTFRIDENLAGIDILNVREINRMLDITEVQHSPGYVRGLVNLRGKTVTVFDLGVRLGLAPRKITSDSQNIILKQDAVGLLVDSIGDVVETVDDQIEVPPANIGGIEGGFIQGVLKLTNELLIILSSEKILEYKPQLKGAVEKN